MAKLRNISTGVVISFDDALVDNFSAAEWESVDRPRARPVAAKAAPAKRAAPRKRAAKKAAAKNPTPAAVKEAVAAATTGD